MNSISRDSNRHGGLDLLRVVSMLLVILYHFLVWGTTHTGDVPCDISLNNGGFVCASSYSVLSALSQLGVICFVLISSYFLYGSKIIRLDKVLFIWIVTCFYSLLITAVFVILNKCSASELLTAANPVRTDRYWFVTKYLALVLLSPFLTVMFEALSKKGAQTALMILTILVTTITKGFPYGNVMFQDSPFSVSVFCFLFFIAGYYKKYGFNGLEKFAPLVFALSIIFQSLLGLAIDLKNPSVLHGAFSIGYNAFSIIPGVALFVMANSISMTRYPPILRNITPSIFAVYLIHDNYFVRNWIWTQVINPTEYWGQYIWVLYAIVVPVIIFAACVIIDMFRRSFFQLIGVEKLLISRIKKNNIAIL